MSFIGFIKIAIVNLVLNSALYHVYVNLSGPNFRPNLGNQASIFNAGSNNVSGIKSSRLKLKENRVEGEIVDVDFKSVVDEQADTFRSKSNYENLAYKTTLYAKVQEQRQELEKDQKARADSKRQDEVRQEQWTTKTAESPELATKREVDGDIAKKLDEINDRLANIEKALGLNGGTKNFKPSSLPGDTSSSIAANPNSAYSKHVSDYSSLVKGMQELHQFKRNMGNA